MADNYDQDIGWLLKEKYEGVANNAFQTDITRIKQGEPVAYVIGFVDFLDCKIDLSRRPLIPRPETEFWTEHAITMIYHSGLKKIRCLDMFAGSGCVGVSILKHVPSTVVDFVDVEPRAIEQIRINCDLNNIDRSRFNIIESDMFENVDGTYDYIFANPPYIAEDKKDSVQESVLIYEPDRALFGGSDGLGYIKAFLDEASKYLNSGGKIYMEFDTHQKGQIEVILKNGSSNNFRFYRDQFKKWRYLVVNN